MKTVLAPGCALMLYKPQLTDKIMKFLNKHENIELHSICCHHEPNVSEPTTIINVCPGCDERFRSRYENIKTVSLWEVIAQSDDFNFPNYNNAIMTVHDACSTKDQERVYNSIRVLLDKMNIKIIEPFNTKDKATCCGYSFYKHVAPGKLRDLMKKRAGEMPCHDVVCYCTACTKSIKIGGKNPRHLLDLLFEEQTYTDDLDLDKWHNDLNEYMTAH